MTLYLQLLSDLTMSQKEDVGNKMLNNNYLRRLLDVFRVSQISSSLI